MIFKCLVYHKLFVLKRKDSYLPKHNLAILKIHYYYTIFEKKNQIFSGVILHKYLFLFPENVRHLYKKCGICRFLKIIYNKMILIFIVKDVIMVTEIENFVTFWRDMI